MTFLTLETKMLTLKIKILTKNDDFDLRIENVDKKCPPNQSIHFIQIIFN